MSDQTNSPTRKGQMSKTVTVVLFIFCAIPGLAIFVYFSGLLFASFFDPHPNLPSPIVSAGTALIGMLLMIVGVGKWKQWGYALVFLSIPVSLFSYFLVDPKASAGKLAPGIVAGCVAFVTFYAVRKLYRRMGDRRKLE